MDASPDFDEDAELVSPDDELVSGPVDPMELEAALRVEDFEQKVAELKEIVSQMDNCECESVWNCALRYQMQKLEKWLCRRRIDEVRQNTGCAAIESGIFTADMRALQVALSGGQFKVDGRDDPLKANHAHEKRTKWNAARKHPERRSGIYKLTARAWNKSEELLKALLFLREIARRCIGGFDGVLDGSLLSEMERKASRMEPSTRARLLELYDNKDLAGWFDMQVWPHIAALGEDTIQREYPDAITQAKSVQNEKSKGSAKKVPDRSLMGALRRVCRKEFVKIIGPEGFS